MTKFVRRRYCACGCGAEVRPAPGKPDYKRYATRTCQVKDGMRRYRERRRQKQKEEQ